MNGLLGMLEVVLDSPLIPTSATSSKSPSVPPTRCWLAKRHSRSLQDRSRQDDDREHSVRCAYGSRRLRQIFPRPRRAKRKSPCISKSTRRLPPRSSATRCASARSPRTCSLTPSSSRKRVGCACACPESSPGLVKLRCASPSAIPAPVSKPTSSPLSLKSSRKPTAASPANTAAPDWVWPSPSAWSKCKEGKCWSKAK